MSCMYSDILPQNTLKKHHCTVSKIRLINLYCKCYIRQACCFFSIAHCQQKTCPGEGFVGKDCKCWCPGNPVTVCDGEGGGDNGGGDGDNEGQQECKDLDWRCQAWAPKWCLHVSFNRSIKFKLCVT